MSDLKGGLDILYKRYNRREFVSPDPLEFLYNYSRPEDIEVAAVVASSLAYGQVKQILKIVGAVLGKTGEHPAEYLCRANERELKETFCGLKYRFTEGVQIARLLGAVKKLRAEYGGLEKVYLAHAQAGETNCGGVRAFAAKLRGAAGGDIGTLIPSPEAGSSFKRLQLCLRWLVRKDAVDTGIWKKTDPALLIVPLDVHMHRVARMLKLTVRAQADMKTALEITTGFRRMSPADPVKYDFCLTRFGIREEMDENDLPSFLAKVK